MKLTSEQAHAIQDLLAVSAIFYTGDKLAKHYKARSEISVEVAEERAVKTLKTLLILSHELKEHFT